MVEYSTIEPWQAVDENGVVFAVGSLYDYFEQVTDPRKARGKRYALVTLLVLIFLAKLSGADTPSAIAAWCQARGPALAALLHLQKGQMPHHNTIRRILAQLDPGVFEQTMRAYGAGQRAHRPERQVLALDGKKEHGTMPAGESQGEATMALYAPEQQEVIAQVVVDAREGEIPTAARLLEGMALAGKVLVADAMHTQRKLSEQVVQAKGDFVFTVKDNQPTTLESIRTLFTTPPADPEVVDFRTSHVVNKGHGRIEERTLTTSSLLNNYLDWPHLAQVFQLIRKFTYLRKGQVVRVEEQVHYGLTSLPAHKASPKQLLEIKRQYWQIETGLHYRRDVTFHEDATRMSHPQAAHNLTILHNTILSLFARLGARNAPFTRQRLDSYINLYWMGSRWYDPTLGRFISPDSIVPDQNNPLDWDRYAYTRNNPINFTDPTGHMVDDDDGVGGVPDYRDLTDWIVKASVYMANDKEVQAINQLLSMKGIKNDSEALARLALAMKKFIAIVKDGARFDVKDQVLAELGHNVKLGDTWFEYSTTGNTLYGFYGAAAGFDLETLHMGAGAAQAYDHFINKEGDLGPLFPQYLDTPDDYAAVDFGFQLYQSCYSPDNSLTTKEFQQVLQEYKNSMALVSAPSEFIPRQTAPYEPSHFDHK